MEEIIVDRAEVVEINKKWYVKGYLDDIEVVTMGGWETQGEHVNAVLYDSQGNEVEHRIVETYDPVDYFRGFTEVLSGSLQSP